MDRVFEFILNHPLNVVAFAMMVGLLVATELRRLGKGWTPQQLVGLINRSDTVVVDLREDKDFQHGHIISSINHPYTKINQLGNTLDKLKGKNVVLVCANGKHSAGAQMRMKKEGYETTRLNGGLIEWSVGNLPLVKGGKEEKDEEKGGKHGKKEKRKELKNQQKH